MEKFLISTRIFKWLRELKFLFIITQHSQFARKNYLIESRTLGTKGSKNKLRSEIMLKAHVLEKGLTMANRRMLFGQDNLQSLIQLCHQFGTQYGTEDVLFQSAITGIACYDAIHKDAHVSLPEKLQKDMDGLLSEYPASKHTQSCSTESSYFHSEANFEEFARSRHSIRQFAGVVPEETISQVIALAQTAPSACNRQSCRVHVVEQGLDFQRICELQQGNRGFGHLASHLLIVTSDMSAYCGTSEMNCMYLDGGIFMMNLLYALHFYHVGACTLMWLQDEKRDRELKQILNTRECIVAMIAIGKIPEKFSYPNSVRLPLDEIVTWHHSK